MSNQGVSIPDIVFSSPSPIHSVYNKTILVSGDAREHAAQEKDSPSTQVGEQPVPENTMEYNEQELTF